MKTLYFNEFYCFFRCQNGSVEKKKAETKFFQRPSQLFSKKKFATLSTFLKCKIYSQTQTTSCEILSVMSFCLARLLGGNFGEIFTNFSLDFLPRQAVRRES